MILAYLGALGGVVVFLGAVWALVAASVRQKDAVISNTIAIDKLTKTMEEMDDKIDAQGNRITSLEGKRR